MEFSGLLLIVKGVPDVIDVVSQDEPLGAS